MTGKTFPFGRNRLMGNFYRRAFILMTSKAKFFSLFGEEERIFRGVGVVAEITLSLLERYVLHITPGLELCWFMTLVAELAAFLCGLQRSLRRWRIMAFVAGNFNHLGMHACFQKLGLR